MDSFQDELAFEFKSVFVPDSGINHEIDLKTLTCSCGREKCPHIFFVRDFIFHKGRANTWTIVSAFHKEIRRSDFKRAMFYARWLNYHRSGENINKYLRNLCFEETRNFSAYQELLSCGDDFERGIQLMAHSVKKWEGPGRVASFLTECEAVQAASKLPQPTHVYDPTSFPTLKDAMTHYWQGKMFDTDKEWKYLFLQVLKKCTKNELIKELISKTEKQSDYFVLALLELQYGEHPPESEMFRPQQEHEPKFNGVMLKFEEYVHDIHTWTGKAKIRNQWNKIQPNQPLPKDIDLRFSGQMLGLLWRHKAFEQYGWNYLEKSWQDVTINENEWVLAKCYDSWWYKRLYFDMEAVLI